MRFVRIVLVAVSAFVAAVAASVSDAPTVEAQFFSSIDISTPGPLGPITIFGDSVLLGSGLTTPTLPDQLASRGWGPIKFRTGVGFNTGKPSRGAEMAKATFWFDSWKSQGWQAENVVINLGANDSAFCGSVECMRGQILTLVDRIGPGHHIWWPQITLETFRRAEQDMWNTALAQIATERDDFETWNWPDEMSTGGYRSSDNIHLTGSGYRQRSNRMAHIITARLAVGQRGGSAATLPTPTSAPSKFVTVTQQRLVDTRVEPAPTGRRRTGDVLRIDLGDSVPEGTAAVALYLAAVDTRASGWLAAAPCGEATGTSSLNFAAGEIRGGPTVSQLGPDGDVCVTVHGDADIVVDLQGAFHPSHTGGLRFDPLATPQRLRDTRETGRETTLQLSAPAGADAVAINLATVNASTSGYLVAAPCDEVPFVASLNYRPGVVIAASAIVKVGDDGTFCVTASSSVDVVVDLTGSFSPTGGLEFV
ncbi:SGNH/GDSL hydrolase family protein, partial [Ilumatobacter sp.]|uniref:SGNH/GDSL hydrolase family protein n=1 Tax=Ilumatobacter sp. TaxID=1967498 RepID=UPI002A24F40D|nr:SGNH/GDSL hydrolase family protein [Ilumatobacter sp.]